MSTNYKTRFWMATAVFLFVTMGAMAQGWTSNNPNYRIYLNGPQLDMLNVPSSYCVGASCGSCGQPGGSGSAGTHTTYSHFYSGSGVSISSDKLTANFTGNKTISARTTASGTTVTFSLSNNVYQCQSTGSSTSTDHSFTVTGVDFQWTSTPAGRCTNDGGSINLYNYVNESSGVTFSGAGVSGNTWSANGLTPGTKTLTAQKVYDNGTATITVNVQVYGLPTVNFTNPPAACVSGSDINLFNYVNVSGGSFSANAGLDLQGTGNGTVDVSDSNPGTYTVTYTYTNGNGCTNTDVATVEIDPSITVDAGANQSSCEGEGSINLVANTSGVTWSCVGCSYVSNGKFNTNTAPPGTYTVRASKTVGACSDTDDKTFTVLSEPTVNAGSNETHCIDEGSISLTSGSPINGTWSGPGVNGTNMNLATAGAGTHTLTYTYTNASNCTASDTKTVTVVALPNASSINVTGDTRCGAGTVDLSASLSGHTIRWFASNSGGSALATGNSYSPSISVGTTTFYVEATNANNCTSSGRKAVTATAYAVPSNPTAPDVDRCGPGTVTLSASGSGAGATYRWYENASGGSALHTGANFTTPSLSSSRSYYVQATSSDNCPSSGRTKVDVTINSIPGTPTTFDDSSCGAGTVNLSVGGAPAGGSYRWYTSDTGGSHFRTSSTYNVSLSETTSYWVSIVTADGCEGARAEVIGTIYSAPTAPNGTGDERCGAGTVNLSVSASNVSQYDWYDTQASSVSLSSGSTYSPTVSSTRSYWVEYTDNNGCVSPRTEVVATVNPIPADPAANNVGRCGPGTVTLSASGSGAGATYRWYANESGGASLHTGATFTTPSITSTRSYYVQATSAEGCISSNRTEVVAEIYSVPGAPVVFDGESCGAGTVNLSVGGASAGGSYRWYNSDTGGTSFNSTNSYEANITGTTSYWVSIVSADGCEGERAEIVATVNPIPLAPSGTDGDRCGTGQVSLSASAPVSGTFNWYETEASAVILSTGTNYTTPIITSTTSYWVEIVDNNGCVSPRTEVVATIDAIPPAPTAPNVSNCGPGMVTLTATGGPSGSVYRWYDNATGGTAIFTGATYEPTVSTTRNYYVDVTSAEGCVSTSRTQVTVTINSIPSTPTVFNGESCGAGIVDLSVGGATAGGSYRWYENESDITPFHTGSSYSPTLSTTTSYWVSILTADGCEGEKAEIVATVNSIPAAPSGTPGERCGTGNVTLGASAGIAGTFNWYETEASAVSLGSSNTFVTPVITATKSFWVDITDANGCVSPRTEVVATVNSIPVDPVADPVERCAAGSVTMTASGSGAGATYNWFESASGGSPVHTGANYTTNITTTKSFYVSATSAEGCVSNGRTQVVATVNAIPGAPVVFDGESCGAGTVNLSVGGASAGGSYRWYNSDTGGTSFNSTSSYSASVTETTSYWVAIVSAEGCEGERAEIVATVNPIPGAPTAVNGSRCGTGQVSLSATAGVGGTFNWYETQASVTSIFTGVNFTTPSISSTTSYWVEITNVEGCTSERTEVVATVNSIPVDPVADPVERCAAGSVTMTASGSGAGATYNWFESASGGSPVHTGANYTTNITTTKSFYVSATSTEGCISANRTQVLATVNPLPGAPVVFDGESCGAGSVNLSVGGASAGGSYRWYDAETGGTSFNSTSSYNASVTETTSYWVSIVSAEGCEGERAEVIATVNPIPAAPTGNPGARCGTGTVSLSASAGSSGTFNWYETEASSVSLFTGINYTTPSISSTRSYWVDFTDLNGCTSERTEVVATVYDVIPDATAPPVERCGAGTVNLNASSSINGATFEWYQNSFGGSPIFTGETFTTPSLSLSREYYVLAISPEGCQALNRTPVSVTINPFPSAPNVEGGSVCGEGTVLLEATGATAGGSYRWYTSDTGGSLLATTSTFTTPTISTTTNYYVSIVNAEGCESSRSQVVATVNDFPGVPTVSDVERCGTGNINLSGSISGSGTINWYLNSSGGSPFATGTSVTVSNVSSNTTYYASTISNAGCESGRVAVNATINPIEDADIGGNITLCINAGGYNLANDLSGVSSSNGVFAGPGVIGTQFRPEIAGLGNHQISFFLTDEIGCLDDGSRIITVIDITDGGTEVTLSETEVTHCVNSGLLDLNDYPSKSGGTWTINAESGSLNVGILDPAVAGVGEYVATYTVAVNGCTVELEMDVNITAAPTAPTVDAPALICTGGEAELSITSTADASDVFLWYRGNETEPFNTGKEITVQPSQTTTYKVQVENAFGCLSGLTSFSIEVSDTEIDFNVSETEIEVQDRVEFTTDIQATSYEWDFGDGFNSVEQSPAHIYFEAGVYDVTLTVITNEGCDATLVKQGLVTVTEDNTVLGLGDDLEESLVVFPQPFVDVLQLEFTATQSNDVRVEMFSLSGTSVYRNVQRVVPGENEITVDGLQSLSRGVYLIRLTDQEGNAKNVKVLKR